MSTPEIARPISQDAPERGSSPTIVSHTGDCRWEGVEVMPYKEDGTHFKSISRQKLFDGGAQLNTELRYFEIQPGGHSTLERHDHEHAVVVIRGRGEVFVGDTVYSIGHLDVVHVPPQTWHQFRATLEEPLGFLCMVSVERDRPQRPTEADRASLLSIAAARDFLQF